MSELDFINLEADPGEMVEGGGGGGDDDRTAAEVAADLSSLDDDALIRVPDQDEPVSWKEWRANHVPLSEYTKGRQELAEQRKQIDQERQRGEQFLREQWAQLQQVQAQMQSQAQPQTRAEQARATRFQQVMQRLQQKGWADGKDLEEAFDAARESVGEMLSPVQRRLQDQEDVLRLMWQHYQQMQQQVGTLGQTHSQQSIEQLFNPLREEFPWANDEVFRDIYHSYEGDDLNEAFPQIVRERLSGISKSYQDYLKNKRAEAKKRGIPSVGGRAAPSLNVKKNLTPQEYARDVFAQLQARGNET